MRCKYVDIVMPSFEQSRRCREADDACAENYDRTGGSHGEKLVNGEDGRTSSAVLVHLLL